MDVPMGKWRYIVGAVGSFLLPRHWVGVTTGGRSPQPGPYTLVSVADTVAGVIRERPHLAKYRRAVVAAVVARAEDGMIRVRAECWP